MKRERTMDWMDDEQLTEEQKQRIAARLRTHSGVFLVELNTEGTAWEFRRMTVDEKLQQMAKEKEAK
jgi:predicted PhzF superfamily epimerase YddE/YHI9